jgi:threonine/homoserine/homoserine lactone efflux protein
MGLLTNLLNPKAAIMYLALIPQFIDPARGHVLAQGLLLGTIQISVSATVNAAIVLAASAIATFSATRPAWLRGQRLVTGVLLAAFALRLALAGG